MKKILAIFLMLATLAACKTHESVREVIVRDSVYIDRVKSDTVIKVKEKEKEVYILDSLMIVDRNDSVYIKRYRRERYNEYIKDSVYEHQLDSLRKQIDHYRGQNTTTTVRASKGSCVNSNIAIIIVMLLIILAIKIYKSRD